MLRFKLAAALLMLALCVAAGAACDGKSETSATTGDSTPEGGGIRVSPTPRVTPSEPTASPTLAAATPDPNAEPTATVAFAPTATPRADGSPYFSVERLTPNDLAARGTGAPGRGAFNIARIIIERTNVDASVYPEVVGADGNMPPPRSLFEVAWYDFSAWPELGGLPNAGGNVVLYGIQSRMGEGIGVFGNLGRLGPGEIIRLVLTDATEACYRVEWNKLATRADVAYLSVVYATPQESVTLITGGIAEGEERVVWGRRVDCDA